MIGSVNGNENEIAMLELHICVCEAFLYIFFVMSQAFLRGCTSNRSALRGLQQPIEGDGCVWRGK